jgi:hypothetical protein
MKNLIPSFINITPDQIKSVVDNRQDIIDMLTNQTYYLVEDDRLDEVLAESASALLMECGNPTAWLDINGDIAAFYWVNTTEYIHIQSWVKNQVTTRRIDRVYISEWSDPADLFLGHSPFPKQKINKSRTYGRNT